MPSKALLKFENKLLVDVEKLIETHEELNHSGGGRRSLGYITRSGVVMLCAAWELYLEELLAESAEKIAEKADSPKSLPLAVQKELAATVKKAKNDLEPLKLAGFGWRSVYLEHIKETIENIHSPKSNKVDDIFHRLLGVAVLSDCWSDGKDKIDGFVETRGEIAHRGSDASYVRIGALKKYREQIERAVEDTDNSVADHIKSITTRSPWNRRL